MEIYSLRSSNNLLYKNHPKTPKPPEISLDIAHRSTGAFQVAEDNAATPDFSAVTPRELREFARANFDSGKIDQETYSALSEELPMHAVDARGQIIDLTGVTDGTSFDFLEYYRNQLELAMSIGDDRMIGRMQSVMAFLRSASIV